MRNELDTLFGPDNWILIYSSLAQATAGRAQTGPLQVAVRGLKESMVIKYGTQEIRAYAWQQGKVWPRFPLKEWRITSAHWAGFRANVPVDARQVSAVFVQDMHKYQPPESPRPERPLTSCAKQGIALDCGLVGDGVDVSDKLTVYWLDGKHDANADASLRALHKQTCKFKLVKLIGYAPLVSALNAMLDCTTPYWVQCDNDMVLKPDAISTLLRLAEAHPEQPLQVCMLYDVLSGRDVQGIKIYSKEVWGSEPWEDVPMPTPHRLAKLGKAYGVHKWVAGEHSPVWTDRAKFDRAADLANIYAVKKLEWIQLDMVSAKDPAVIAGYTWGMHNTRSVSKDRTSAGYAEYAKSLGHLKIGHLVDQYGWAFDHIATELAAYTRHSMCSFTRADMDTSCDVVHSHGLGCGADDFDVQREYKTIGQYSGCCSRRYSGADVELSIAEHINKTFDYPDSMYYAREGIDTYFWTPAKTAPTAFVAGWSGRNNAVKRPWLLDQLCVPVERKSDWGAKFFVRNRNRMDQLMFYHNISCLVLTSVSECQPRVILEAMSCGLPVIAPRVGGIPLMLEADWCVDVDETACVNQMNERLAYLQDHPDEAAKIGLRNRLRAERYWSWSVLAPIWDDLYCAVAANDRASIEECSRRFRQL